MRRTDLASLSVAILSSAVPATPAWAQPFTAATIGSAGEVLYARTTPTGEAILTSLGILGPTEMSLGQGTVSDLESTALGIDVAAFEDGRVRFLNTTGQEFLAPIGGLSAVAIGMAAEAYGSSTLLAICAPGASACVLLPMQAPVRDLSFLGGGTTGGDGDLAVVSGGEVLFFDGTQQVATLHNGISGVGIHGFRGGPGGLVGIGVGPCMVVDAELTEAGMLIEQAGVRLVPFGDLQGVQPFARAQQTVLLGTLFASSLSGDLLLDDLGRIVEEGTGVVLGELTAVSIFPTAVASFDSGSPLVALALGGSAVMLDPDGTGPVDPIVLAGAVEHLAFPQTEPSSFKRGSQGLVTAHVEIMGGFVDAIVVSTATLAGVPAQLAGFAEDDDADGEPDRPIKFPRTGLAAVLPDGESTVLLEGQLLDGTPFRGTAVLTIH